jgi:O-antigen/teichoic acid export membrane protein
MRVIRPQMRLNENGEMLERSVGMVAPVTTTEDSAATTVPSTLRGRLLGKSMAEIKDALEGPIVRNAASLYGTTIVTSILGFVYWFVAARMAPASAVGTASAIQSAAQFLGIFCVIGLNTLLISELAADKSQARSIILTAAAGVGVAASIISAGVGIGLANLSSTLRQGLNGPGDILIFAVLGASTTILVLLDDACIGLLRGDLQLRRNAVFAVSKLALLPLLIWAWGTQSGVELVIAWLAGLAISLATLAFQLAKLTKGQSSRLDFPRIFEKRRLVMGHHWLNLSIQSPRLVLPVLVAVIVGTKANAAFTAAFLVVSFVNVIPSQLSTVLFALAPGDEADLHIQVRKTMRICLVISIITAPFFVIFAPFILRLFGHDYVTAAAALAILGFATYPQTIKAHYVAIARVRGRMQNAALWTLVGGCLEIGFSAVGAIEGGLTGLAIAYLIAATLEAILFSPSVFGVLRKARDVEPEVKTTEER